MDRPSGQKMKSVKIAREGARNSQASPPGPRRAPPWPALAAGVPVSRIVLGMLVVEMLPPLGGLDAEPSRQANCYI